MRTMQPRFRVAQKMEAGLAAREILQRRLSSQNDEAIR
jgi:hypothetical protein